jgi:hypothetical protein
LIYIRRTARRDRTEEATAMLDALILFPKSAGAEVVDDAVPRIVELMKQASGLRSLRVSEGELMGRGGPPPFSRVIAASFGDLADWMALVDVLNSQPDLTSVQVEPLVMFYDARDA